MKRILNIYIFTYINILHHLKTKDKYFSDYEIVILKYKFCFFHNNIKEEKWNRLCYF